MVKRLRKVGNSTALILDRPILELLGLEPNGEVQLTVQGRSLILTAANPRRPSRDDFERAVSRVVSRRRGLLKQLAE